MGMDTMAGSPADKATHLKTKALQLGNRVAAIYLSLLEDLANDHDNALDKLRTHLPADYKHYVDLADYLSEARFESLRNRVLKAANDARREMGDEIKQIRFE